MKLCFVPAGPIEWGSSRMRVYWPANILKKNHEVVITDLQNARAHTAEFAGRDAYIFQKTADAALMRTLKKCGGRVFWDVCDPSWWWQPQECQEILAYTDEVVACTEPLACDFYEWSGVQPRVIPDRLEMSHFSAQRVHAEIKPVRFIWFGVATNRTSLFSAVANLERLVANGYRIELTIMDDRPESAFPISNNFPIYYARWSLDQEVAVITGHDIALLPPYPGPWGDIKSNNKHLTAWACGLPVLSSDSWSDYLAMMNPCHRQEQAAAGHSMVLGHYTIEKSADQWEELLCK